MLRSLTPRIVLSAAPVVAASLLLACGAEVVPPDDLGVPPAGGVFNPGSGAGGGPYGYGGGSTDPGAPGGPVTPPVCPEDLKRCEVLVTYPAGTETAVEIRGDFRGAASWQQGIPMRKNGAQWEATVPVPLSRAVQYKICVTPGPGTCGEWRVDRTKPTVTDVDGNENNLLAPTTCAEPICEDAGQLPTGVFDWRDATIYFMFVDRFFDSDGNKCGGPQTSGPISAYMGGDWKGIEQKIPYLKKLGVNTLWLTVPAENTQAAGRGIGGDNQTYSGYHGYWPSDLDSAENCFASGALTVEKSIADLQSLTKALHENGMKVLLDYAMVHVHRDSPIYAQNRNWFWPNDNGRGGNCICGETCDWNADGKRCWFTDYLPHWDYRQKGALDYSVANALSWITKAAPPGDRIDGFRLDAIKHVEDPWLTTLRSRVQAEVVSKMPAGSRFYMVGETFSYSVADLQRYIDPATKLDGQFDFPARLNIVRNVLMRQGSIQELGRFLNDNENLYGRNAIMSPFIGNHDLGRVVHMAQDRPEWDQWDNGSKSKAWNNLSGQPLLPQPTGRAVYERMANGFAVILTNKGAPLIYYGDEVGLAGAGDPDNRRPMPFCSAANMASPTAIGAVCSPRDGDAVWSADQTWLFDRVAKLLAIRKEHPALRRGRFSVLQVPGDVAGDVLAYSRATAEETLYVVVNRGDTPRTVSVLPQGTFRELVEGGSASGAVTVPARQARVYVR